ncbi:glycerate kinase [Gracilibacillus halophilus YIM-C55.5]|uniref:Glycerate kinase n=1 Tax=Gracilibacillus halophilus YIM-C55.5 TaxID=1308866 RepID=N4WC60_9BACI|nr:glycerate kinase [Gracilibacillus halophilus]ENH97873.1 glycerate kinase [Gracilibacillus halophilus YIM-C55.5]
MEIVVAPDSFKGSLTSIEVAQTMKAAIDRFGKDTTIIKPMADGGEGTIAAILASTEGEEINVTTSGPLGTPIQTSYAIIDKHIAVIETAKHAGLTQVIGSERNPDDTTSFGIGEAMLHALDNGCDSFIIGLGGSATNDGGLGMLQALGLEAWDKDSQPIGPFGKDLLQIHDMSVRHLDPRLSSVHIQIASDVDNPLTGTEGATMIYGPQKGASNEQISLYDQALDHFASLMEKHMGTNYQHATGAGAAGGLGFAFLSIGGSLQSGAKLIADVTNLEETIQQADLVITGEGQSDNQTLYGKAPGFIADLASHHHVPAILLSGGLGKHIDALQEKFIGCFSIVNRPLSLHECMEECSYLLEQQTKQLMTLINYFRTI